ncbi:hypothetical protein SAMN04487996_12855 [Dyadobacter soli]|uniref:Uncharacterized protein n=1 Tax=Dyadobacter soli TaxID=659014 RepID=A0A1G7ZK23_9BACT|nr:hypothetical protein [Dyadobacter soli]SDH09058.1 hypothetical protein SAMN04487996_12855 [Dyadobacter soli]
MIRFFTFTSLLVLIASIVISCNEKRNTIPVNNAAADSLAPEFITLKASGRTEEELVRLLTEYVWFVKENLIQRNKTYSLTEQELNALRDAQSDRELNRAINGLGGNGGVLVRSFPHYRDLSKSVEDQNLDMERISKLVARKITEKIYQNRFGTQKIPECAKLCRRQLNTDMESCENELALEIGATLVAGAISVGMVRADGLVFVVGAYFNCESTAFASFDVCSMNCGVN